MSFSDQMTSTQGGARRLEKVIKLSLIRKAIAAHFNIKEDDIQKYVDGEKKTVLETFLATHFYWTDVDNREFPFSIWTALPRLQDPNETN